MCVNRARTQIVCVCVCVCVCVSLVITGSCFGRFQMAIGSEKSEYYKTVEFEDCGCNDVRVNVTEFRVLYQFSVRFTSRRTDYFKITKLQIFAAMFICFLPTCFLRILMSVPFVSWIQIRFL